MERPHARRARHARARRARRAGVARRRASGTLSASASRSMRRIAGASCCWRRRRERLEDDRLPPGLVARGIAVLEEGLREEAIDTIAFLVREGVEIKIISGDGLATVQAVALAAGVPDAERGIAGPDLPDDPDALAEAVQEPRRLRTRAPGPEAGTGAGAHALGQVRRDGRRRRERRARTQGGEAGDRDGQRQPDGEGRGRPRAAHERVLDRAACDRGGQEDPAQHAPSRTPLRHEERLLGVPRRDARDRADRLSVPPAASHDRLDAHGRASRLLPRARLQRGARPERGIPPRRRAVRGAGRRRGRDRRSRPRICSRAGRSTARSSRRARSPSESP